MHKTTGRKYPFEKNISGNCRMKPVENKNSDLCRR
jgi:hypothetical protein